MTHSIAEKPASREPSITTSEVDFDSCCDQHFFSTNAGISLPTALAHASCLLGGVKEVIQTEADLELERGGRGISCTHYMLLTTIDAISALIESAETTVRKMQK